MGLFDGRKKSKTAVPQGGAIEVGVAGQSMASNDGTEFRSDTLKIDDYIKMLSNDGTIAALYNILTLPIRSASYTIDADEADSSEEQADLVRKNLLNPPHKGGMQTPFSFMLADVLRATNEGFRLFELTWRVEDGKVVYDKIASRDSRTITLKRGDDGSYDGAVQKASYKGEMKETTLPAWKTFLFTYNKDRNYLYGESAFKAAAFHYDKKHKYYKLIDLAIQAAAIPPRIVYGPDADLTGESAKKNKNLVLSVMEQFGIGRTTAYMPAGYKVEAYKGEGQDILPYVDHQDTQMARSVLAQFIMLGTTSGSKGGSHALSSDQSDLFILAVKGVMQNIEDHINSYLIPALIDLNFPQPSYPEFHFEDLTDTTKAAISTAFNSIISSAGGITEAMARGIQDRMAEQLDIDLEDIQKTLDQETEKKIADAKSKGIEVGPDGNPLPPPVVKPVEPGDKIKLSDEAAGDDPKGSTSVKSAFSLLK